MSSCSDSVCVLSDRRSRYIPTVRAQPQVNRGEPCPPQIRRLHRIVGQFFPKNSTAPPEARCPRGNFQWPSAIEQRNPRSVHREAKNRVSQPVFVTAGRAKFVNFAKTKARA